MPLFRKTLSSLLVVLIVAACSRPSDQLGGLTTDPNGVRIDYYAAPAYPMPMPGFSRRSYIPSDPAQVAAAAQALQEREAAPAQAQARRANPEVGSTGSPSRQQCRSEVQEQAKWREIERLDKKTRQDFDKLRSLGYVTDEQFREVKRSEQKTDNAREEFRRVVEPLLRACRAAGFI
jgi:hypothetical protein